VSPQGKVSFWRSKGPAVTHTYCGVFPFIEREEIVPNRLGSDLEKVNIKPEEFLSWITCLKKT
jgi:hypothetical protein